MGKRVCDADDALNELRSHFEGRERELLVGLFLDANLWSCGEFAIEGGRGNVTMQLAQFVGLAAGSGAAFLVLAHNHPSGDPTPSADDKNATMAMARACEHLGIRVLDHLIIATGGVTSMRALGLI